MIMSVAEITKTNVASVEVSWRPDPDAESVIEYVGLRFEERQINIDQIDWNESANNCARMLNPLNEEKIEDYATCMRGGDVFPMVVVEQTKTSYVILGGNQRLNAAKRISATKAGAYVVRGITTSQRECLIRSLNARHGWGTSKEERIQHALFLVMEQGVSVLDAAKLMVVSDATLHKHMRAKIAKASLAKVGIDTSAFSIGHFDALEKVQDEDMQAEIARIASTRGVTGESVKSVVDSVCAAKSRAAMASKIKEWSKELAPVVAGKSKVMSSPRRDKFFRLLSSLNEFLERGNSGTGFSSMDELQCSSIDSDRVKMLSAKILIRLKTIAGV
jgi:hypothetical protein